ncbi:MAG: hemerythrin domain-containing protein [bacterium]
MPRHATLIPLSHDHHEALLVALRIKKGGPVSLNDRMWPADFHQQIRAIKLYCERELLPHFAIEEEFLFPVADWLTGLNGLMLTLRSQHEAMRNFFKHLTESPDEATSRKLVEEFGSTLEAHVRLEERELFPALERASESGLIVLPSLK